MGVSCVYDYPVPDGRSGAQVVDVLQKQVETMGAYKTGNFHIDCETYQSVMLNSGIQSFIGSCRLLEFNEGASSKHYWKHCRYCPAGP